MEGLIRAEADILAKLFGDIDVLVLQKTHVSNEETSHLKINGFDQMHHIVHNKNNLATYVSQKKLFPNIEQMAGNEHKSGIHIGNLTIFSV